MQTYDVYFIYAYFMENSIILELTISSGSKIMYMKVRQGLNINVLDWLKFLPILLANLVSSFALQEMKKGFWATYIIHINTYIFFWHLCNSLWKTGSRWGMKPGFSQAGQAPYH